ncbi:unnamed protein product, partial [Ectocarpus fasciculatus]
LKSTTTTNSSSSGSSEAMAATNSSSSATTTMTYEKWLTLPRPRTFYRRELKPPCVAFSSGDGRQLFREALVAGTMECYFRLAEQFRTQDEVAFCGLSTLTMVLNALAVDPGRVWKGPWRWYDESMLDCCAPLETVKDKGITLATLSCLARCNGLSVDVARTDTHTLEDLRAVVEECSSAEPGRVVVVSYDRRGLKQTGTGHFSPVGGYHKEKDLVLILDTARFKLPPHWVPLPVLWEAMQWVDPETDRPRGYMVVEKAHSLSHRLFYANARNYKDWPKVASWVNEMIELACGDPEEENEDLSGLAGGNDDSSASGCPAAAAAAAELRESRRALRDATTVADFVPALMALLPP